MTWTPQPGDYFTVRGQLRTNKDKHIGDVFQCEMVDAEDGTVWPALPASDRYGFLVTGWTFTQIDRYAFDRANSEDPEVPHDA